MPTALRKRTVRLSVLALASLALLLTPGTAQATTCDGGYQFHWHWNDDSLFFDTTWGSINQAKPIDGTFQVTNSAPQQYQGYPPRSSATATCPSTRTRPRTNPTWPPRRSPAGAPPPAPGPGPQASPPTAR